MLERRLNEAEFRRGPILRPVYGGAVLPCGLSASTVARLLKKLACRAGLDEEEVARTSGHSLRIGAAQQLTIDGHAIPQIMHAGGWRSIPVVARYVENVGLRLWD